MIDSVLDVFEVFMSYGHADLTKFVNHLILRVLTFIFKVCILAIEHLAEGLLSLLGIDL